MMVQVLGPAHILPHGRATTTTPHQASNVNHVSNAVGWILYHGSEAAHSQQHHLLVSISDMNEKLLVNKSPNQPWQPAPTSVQISVSTCSSPDIDMMYWYQALIINIFFW
ncbi:hypothetical protein O0I10_009250 [Lichtheimia ornata]|uniref:Uncharacterized protein n=1 Tax=Lichtheimia ornata TaxID=688661 RepID=A0AAD7XVZ6_9FUNG|nr:uncharacterized protein O0I10_009250 [Lichtheimia ornata]KAJ8655043.1 hypothetical protein O0I10_009250 [Lichtheimia ornata]